MNLNNVSDWVAFGMLLTFGVLLWVFSAMSIRDDATNDLDDAP